jgi:hypothetical protein
MTMVVDTNVPLVAKHADEHPTALADACAEMLEDILEGKRPVATDLPGEIVEEYFHKLSRSGMPTVGDAFARYVHDMRFSWDSSLCPDIGARGGDCYEVLDGDDSDIDPSDRKFVAVAKAAAVPVVQAADTKWLDWGDVLARHGVEVRYAHEPSIRAAYREKFGREAP